MMLFLNLLILWGVKMRTPKRKITVDVEIDCKLIEGAIANIYQLCGIRTPELENICKEIIENEEGFNDQSNERRSLQL
jgi:hypothetical protein